MTPARLAPPHAPAGIRLAAPVLLACVLALTGCAGWGGNGSSSSNETRPGKVQQAEALAVIAQESVRSGDTERALQQFAAAIELNPRLTRAHLGMADIYRVEGDYESAAESYGTAAEIEPRDFDSQFYHGLMLHLLDRITDAIQAYLRALQIDPNDFRTNLNLSAAYYQLEENNQALEYGRRAVQLDPEDGEARFNLGAVYASMRRHQDAVNEYQQAAELMPLTSGLLLNLAESLKSLNRYEEMLNAVDQVVRTEPSAAAHERRGFALFRLGRFEDALGAFEDALDIDEDYYPALNGIGISLLNRYIQSGQKDVEAHTRAIAMLRRSIKINRDQPRVLELLSTYSR